MLADYLITYDCWDLEKPLIPKRSRLYQLEPVGVGTPYVESLTGYIARLCESHSVLPGVLISREIAPLIKKIFIKQSTSRGLRALFDRATALNGTGDMAIDLVQVLQELTLRNDLNFLTLLFWGEIIPSRNLFRAKRAWCPYCYEEWRIGNKMIYEPLLWAVTSVKVCPHHGEHLCDQCPHCHQRLPLLSWRSRPGYCSNCDEWLGMNLVAEPSTKLVDSEVLSGDELQWQSWVVKVIGELIACAPSFESSPPKENIAKSLSLVINIVTEGNIAAFARLLEIPKNTLWMWQTGKALPQLDIWLKICYRLEISLLDFLSPEKLGSRSFSKILQKCKEQAFFRGTTLPRTPRVSPKSFDPNQVRDAILVMLASNEEPPPTMKEVAKRLGYDRRTICSHFPDLCRTISAKCRSYGKACHLKKIQQSCEEVQQIAHNLYHQGVYLTEARVSELMTHPGYFRYKQVRAVLHEARRELGL